MAVRRICAYPEAVLRQKAKPVETIDDDLQRLIDDMIETMYAAPGVGLAATQIGVALRQTGGEALCRRVALADLRGDRDRAGGLEREREFDRSADLARR